MLRLIQYLIWVFIRGLLALRYRIRVNNKEQLQDLKGPVLFLSNHPALIDPALFFISLWPGLRPRPIVYGGTMRNPLLYPIMKALNVLVVPDLEKASSNARSKAEEVIEEIIQGLKDGQNYCLWPAGQIQHEGIEHIGGARSTSEILKNVEDLTIILVRSRGIWGSSFSWAPTGSGPSMTKSGLKGFGYLFANLLFFMPRRDVEYTIKVMDRNDIPELERDKLNRWLEDWFNGEEGQETPTFVPYHFLFGKRTYEFPELQVGQDLDLSNIKPKTKQTVREILSEKLERQLTDEEYQATTGLDVLGLDSIDRMDVTLHVEQRFGFSGGDSPLSVGQLWALAEGLADRGQVRPAPELWNKPPSDKSQAETHGDSIAEALVNRVFAHPGDVAIADDLSGALTYERFLVGALLMAKRFAKLEKPNVGVLLPASIGGDLAFFGLHFAGKLPVLLNWTTGPGNLAHAVKTMDLDKVITSKAFIDRTGIEVEGAEYLFLDDVKAGIGFLEKIGMLLKVKFRKESIRANVPKAKPDDNAFVLFTSGSEKAPKAVPLTQKNIISDLHMGVPVLELTREDSILGFLPAFHSFGITVTSILPLVCGVKLVRHPDPTDAGGLVRKIEAYKPTCIAGTPTFVSHIFDRAEPGQLDSLRLIFMGAEKCPDRLFDRCKEIAPNATLLEGYGITECSPVIAVNPPHATRKGSVGKPLPGLDLEIVNLDTDQPCDAHQQGMIQVSSPTVFNGYINYDGPSPFVERDGKRWYVTGDLGELDSEGYIWFRGRLKRFLKAGGEMISLPALEEPFAAMFPPTEDGPRVAVEGIETDHGRHIVLFTTQEISVKDANKTLMDNGFRGVMRLDEVIQIDAIPTLGTGKTDYKVLRKQIEEKEAEALSGTGS